MNIIEWIYGSLLSGYVTLVKEEQIEKFTRSLLYELLKGFTNTQIFKIKKKLQSKTNIIIKPWAYILINGNF